MGWEAWISIGVVVLVVGLLVITRIPPDIILIGGVTLLFALGILDAKETLGGLADEGLATVGVLYIVVAGLRETGAIGLLTGRILGRPASQLSAMVRVMAPVMGLSAFLNNTPVVAMMIPAVTDWAKKFKLTSSKLLIPLSYAAILGGTCTLIGTSTNLVVNGMMGDYEGADAQFGLFDIAWIGLPCALIGMTYLLTVGRALLPDHRAAFQDVEDPRTYTAEMLVEAGGPLVGKTIEEAGLRHLERTFLAEIDRGDRVLPAVSPREVLQANDRLVFVGVVDDVVELQRMRGLTPATDQVFKLDSPRPTRTLIEAVVSDTFPHVGRTVRESNFRTKYNAVIIAVSRNGERIRKKIGNIILRPGDTLLLEAPPSFVDQQRHSRDFFLVSPLPGSSPMRHDRAYVSLAIMLSMVIAVTVFGLSILKGAMLAAGLMLITRCCRVGVARNSVDWKVLLVIAAAFALGKSLDKTGAAGTIAQNLIGFAQDDPWLALAVVYGMTMLFTEMITNNAAAVLMFPIALATSRTLDVSMTPYAVAIMMAASASFSTPIGYQTNLMVYGPGGYRFTDYFKVGIPLNLLMWGTTVLLAPMVWPF